ncbi:mitofusin complex protein UGO1 [Sporobolomyces koalae]|uniref:mitofusin complex protein UGO1 n=1 Tax=Sporobolomyces koalae TaxID=500713 RepID=UPI00317B1AB6
MDAHPSVPVQHPLRPYSVAPSYDDFAWSNPPAPSSSRSTPPSLRYPPASTSDSAHDRYASSLDYDAGALPSAGTLLHALVTSSLLSFTGVALVQPFEVGKTLAQVQWVPKDGVLDLVQPEDNAADHDDVIHDETEAEHYFADLASVSEPGFAPPSAAGEHLSLPRPVDPAGYLSDTAARPEWVMPIVVQGGVWDMIKAIGRWKGEGWKSLWKGQLTTFIYDTISTSLQPSFLSLLTLVLSPLSAPTFTALPLIYSPRPLPLLLFTTISHTLTTVVLSPLDLVRTRLIVQSAQPQHRKYSNPISALRTILREEGGFHQTYLHPNLLIPTVLEGVLRPLLHLSIPLVITRYFQIEPSTSPIWFATVELALSSASLLVTIPLETIRKRLQLQSRAEYVRAGRAGGVGKPWRSCVETRPVMYSGVVECVWRILTEETGKIPRRRRLRRKSSVHQSNSGTDAAPEFNRSNSGMSAAGMWEEELEKKEDLGQIGLGSSGGLRQLYRGLSMGLGANVVVFLLGILAGGGTGTGTGGSGWAEM